MTDNTTYPHIVVIGNIPDGDSYSGCFENMTIAQAHQAFENEIWEGEDEGDKEIAEKLHGAKVWIERTICSVSPMMVLE